MKKKLLFFTTFFLFFLYSFFASSVGSSRTNFSDSSFEIFPSYDNYITYDDGDTVFIFPEKIKKWIPNLIKKNQKLKEIYRKEFLWSLDNKLYILLASPQNHIPNAYAVVSPHYNLTLFNGAIDSFSGLSSFNGASWIPILLIHEGAHIYQITPKTSAFSRVFHSILGNVQTPFFLFPNLLTPRFMLEGNATYNESRFGLGGRLYSPSYRAMVFSLFQEKKVTTKRLMNDHLYFPMNEEKYVMGGYFNEFLHSQYKNPNLFFLHQSENWIYPLAIDKTFKRTFGKSYFTLIKEFNQFYSKEAEKQKRVLSPSIAKSFFHFGINRSQEKIFFITSKDLRSENRLNIYSIEKNSLKVEKKDIPQGKLFLLDDQKFYSRSNQWINKHTIQFSLFGENLKMRKEYKGKYVYDIRNGYTLYANADESFFEIPLYLNDKKHGFSYTSPLLDDSGNVFDFKQEGEQSFLLKNNKVLFSFDSYFPKLVDVSPKGKRIYFIGATKRGSSLFAFDVLKKEVYRLSRSDRIIDAKETKNGHFLVAEVSGAGYSYHVIKSKSSEEEIEVIKKEKPFKVQFQAIDLSEDKKGQKERHQLFQKQNNENLDFKLYESKMRPYNHIRFLRYAYTKPFFYYSGSQNFKGNVNVHFSDPLSYNGLILGVSGEHHQELQRMEERLQGFIQYVYSKSIIDMIFEYSYNEFKYSYDENETILFNFKDKYHSLSFLGSYPFFYKKRWLLRGFLEGGRIFTIDKKTDDLSMISGELRLTYNKTFQRSFYPYRSFLLRFNYKNYFHSLFSNEELYSRSIYLGEALSSFDLGLENFIHISLGSVFSESPKIFLLSRTETTNLEESFKNPYLLPTTHLNDDFISTIPSLIIDDNINFSWGSLRYSKVFNFSWYHGWFPLALRRFAPFFLIYESYEWKDKNSLTDLTLDKTLGLDIELLVGKNLPVHLVIYVKTDDLSRVGVSLSL